MRSSCLVHWASSLKTIIEASFMCTKPDVIVVGAGLAGMSAAIAAAAQGASVVVIDRGHGGGTSAVSGGVVYAGGGTRQQAIAGYGDDSPENMCRYLALEVGSAVSDATLSTFCRESVHMIEWLESLGAKFEGTLCPFRTSFPTSQYSLYFSGNEKARPFSDVARPAPRGHRAVAAHQSGMSMTGRDLWQAVFESALHIGIKFHAASWVQELRLDTRGAVGGIRFRVMSPDAPLFRVHKALTRNAAELHAMSMQPVAAVLDRIANFIWDRQAKDEEMHSGAVILAAGSYIRDKGLSRQYIPWSYRVATLGTAGDDGGGIRLAQSVGAAVDFLNHSSVSRMLYPPESLSEGIVVSPNGQRVAAEDLYGATMSRVLIEQHEGYGFLILDSDQWKRIKNQIATQTETPWRYLIQFIVYWGHKKGATIERLAEKIGVDAQVMRTTIIAYNNAIIGRVPDPVGKIAYRSAIETGPFYSIDISLRRSGLMVSPAMGLGGVRTESSTGEVLDVAGAKIPRLYAAGKNAVGISSNKYISGLALADCVFSGRRAGEHASTAIYSSESGSSL